MEEVTVVENGVNKTIKKEKHQALKAMIYVPLTPGTHTVTMSYTPPGFVMGLVLMLIGIAMCVVFYRFDSQNNKVLLARANSRKAARAQSEREQKEKQKAEKSASKPEEPAKDEDDDEEEDTPAPDDASDVPSDDLTA